MIGEEYEIDMPTRLLADKVVHDEETVVFVACREDGYTKVRKQVVKELLEVWSFKYRIRVIHHMVFQMLNPVVVLGVHGLLVVHGIDEGRIQIQQHMHHCRRCLF